MPEQAPLALPPEGPFRGGSFRHLSRYLCCQSPIHQREKGTFRLAPEEAGAGRGGSFRHLSRYLCCHRQRYQTGAPLLGGCVMPEQAPLALPPEGPFGGGSFRRLSRYLCCLSPIHQREKATFPLAPEEAGVGRGGSFRHLSLYLCCLSPIHQREKATFPLAPEEARVGLSLPGQLSSSWWANTSVANQRKDLWITAFLTHLWTTQTECKFQL